MTRAPHFAIAAAALSLTACRQPPLRNLPPRNPTICCFGDSLVAGIGAGGEEHAYPAQLAAILDRPVTALGTPGDTTADGLAKAGQFLDEEYGIIIVTLGGNDILKRIDWPRTEANLNALFPKLTATGAAVAFTGVTGPLNPSRTGLYRKICRTHGVLFIPAILAGIKNNPERKADEIHPNAEGYRLVAERVAAALDRAGMLETAL